MKLIKIKCEHCGATMKVNSDLDEIECKYCGDKIIIDDKATELRRVENVKLESRKSNHEQKLKEIRDFKELKEEEAFKKKKIDKILVISIVVAGFFTIGGGFRVSSIFSIIQIICFLISWLMGMKIIKSSSNNSYMIPAAIGYLLIIPFLAFINTEFDFSDKEACQKIDWNDIYLNKELVNIKSPKGEIISNTKNGLYLRICNINLKDYNNYVKSLKQKGYKIDIEDNTNTFLAYNEEGYKIYIIYDEDDKELTIDLDEPIEMSKIKWPNYGLAKKIPTPSSLYGKISSDSDDFFGAYIGNTSKKEFEEYVEACRKKGFTKNHTKTETYYSANNFWNYEITIEYLGNKTMHISIEEREND